MSILVESPRRIFDAKSNFCQARDCLFRFFLTEDIQCSEAIFPNNGENIISSGEHLSALFLADLPHNNRERKAFHGLCIVVVKSIEKAGAINLRAKSEELKDASIVIKTKI
jgi:hypothetical protein